MTDDPVPFAVDATAEITRPLAAPIAAEPPLAYVGLSRAIRHAATLLEGVPRTAERLALLGRIKYWLSTALIGLEHVVLGEPRREEPDLAFARRRLSTALDDVEQLIRDAQAEQGLVLIGRVRHALAVAVATIERLRRAERDRSPPSTGSW